MAIYMFSRALPRIGGLQVDAHIKEDHKWSNDVPIHPIEQGYSIQDAVIRKPMVLQLESVVSVSPINPEKARNKSPYRADQAYSILTRLANAGSIITVVTGLRTYSNMVITDLSIPRSAEEGMSLFFSITLQHIRTVSSKVETTEIVADTGNADQFDSSYNDYASYGNVQYAIALPDVTRVDSVERVVNNPDYNQQSIGDATIYADTKDTERIGLWRLQE